MYLLLLAVIYLAFISLGLPDSLLGSAWPSIHTELDIPLSYMGIISMIISGLAIITSLLSEKVTKRFSTRSVTAVSILLTALGMYGFSHSKNLVQLCLWTIPYGVGGGAIDAALNNYVAQHYSSKHINWLHCFWGVGTIISPYLMGYAVKNYHWTVGYRMVAFLQIVIFVIFLLSFPLWKVNKDSQTQENKNADKISQLIKIDGVKAILVGFFCYCSAEATCMLWASSYLAECRGLSAERAATFGSLFCIGITAGRLISGFVAEKAGDKLMIRIGLAIILIGTILIALPVNYVVALVGFVVVGLGCAPVYPSIIHATPDAFGKENSQSVIGMQMAFAYVGSTFMPPLFGVIAKYTNMSILPYYVMLFALIMVALTECFYKIKKKQSA